MTIPQPHADTDDSDGRLLRLGISRGHWPLPIRPPASPPEQEHAVALRTLQDRFGSPLTDRLRWPLPRPRAATPARGVVEPDGLHVHDDVELRVLLSGRVRYIVADGTAPLLLDLNAGDWIALPAGLPHRLLPRPGPKIDLLCLFSKPGRWAAQAVDPALEWPG